MKILHCLNQYMPQAMGGTEIYTHALALAQKDSGHEAAVITPHIEYYRPGEINEHYKYEGIDVYQFLETGNPKDRRIHYGEKKPEGLENFHSLIQQLKPDVIHFHEINRSIGFTAAHVKLARQSQVKIFLTMHLPFYSCNTNVLVYDHRLCDGLIRDFRCTDCSYKTLFNVPPVLSKSLTAVSTAACRSGIARRLPEGKTRTLLSVPSTISRIKRELHEVWSNTDQMISLNKWYRDILIANGVPENKISVVPQALVPVIKKRGDVIRQGGLPIKIVFVGRIYPIKGVHLIIEAMRSFSPRQVQMDIYGKQENTAYYHQCIRDSKPVASITWKGEISREDVLDRLAQYDIFCLASTSSEMAPLVIQEAFAAGLPVLASRVYGNMAQIRHGHNGLLFDFNSSQNLREQVQLLVDNPAMIGEMRNNVVPPKSFDTIVEAYLQLYMAEYN